MHWFTGAAKEQIRNRTARVPVGAEVPGEGPWAWGASWGPLVWWLSSGPHARPILTLEARSGAGRLEGTASPSGASRKVAAGHEET